MYKQIIGEKWAQQRVYGIKFHGPPFLNKFLLDFLDKRSIVEFVNIFVELFKAILHAC